METKEIKQQIKDYFVESIEDRFTKVKSIKCNHKIEWKGKDLENKFMLTKNSYSNTLSMGIDYRYKNDIDSIFFEFTYSNSDGGYPGMTNIKMFVILDDDRTVELSDASGFDHTSQTNKVGDNYINIYVETAQLAISMSDFIAIANAKKIEYSIRFGQGSLEKTFDQNEILLFKGFYNACFDADFEMQFILNSIKNKFIQKDLLLNLQKFIISSGYDCVKTDINIEQFRFTPHQHSPIQLDANENVIFAIYSNSFNKSLCDVLITNKKLYYFNNWNKVKAIELKGSLAFEVGRNFMGLEKLMEKNSSFSITLTIRGISIEISNVLNSIIKNNNEQQ